MYRAKLQEGNGEEFGKTTCTSEIQAAFILSSFVTFFSGLLILFLCRLLWKVIKKGGNFQGTGFILDFLTSGSFASSPIRRLYFYGVFRDRIEMLLSAQTFVGQVLFLAADDKIKFWLEMNSIVDIFTIPPTFISYYLKSNWLGLRFLRALRLLELPRILQILQAIKTSNSVKFSKLLSIALSTWFTAAGFIHLVENSGDPWLKGRNSQNITYFESIYLVMATTSTVGFGDVVAKTSLGRTFIMFFTLGSLILFANYIPEMVELFANKRKYTSSYEVVKGKKFIVVCGNITVDSVTAFLRNFLRHKSGEINTEIVFLGEVTPSLELETIFKCYLAYTTFISGSALKWEDLRRVAISPKQTWQRYFLSGLKNKILTQRLSDDFAGMSFPEVSRLCFVKMNLMLIAIEYKSLFQSGYCGLILNPPAQIKLRKNTLGFFIAESSKEVRRTFLGHTEQEYDRLDSTGMFHWCRAIPLETVTLKRSEKSKHEFRNHIIACIFGDAHSALMGLRNFVMPLRASNYTRQELKDIVFLGSLDYMQKEWRFLRNFPQIYILPGSALYPADLHAVNIEKCSMCAILAPPPKPSSSQTLVDTETIMATLNIGSLRIITSTENPLTQERSTTHDFSDSYRKSKYRRIPILTELKNPSNIHFIEQIGGLEGNFTGTSLHLSTSFSTGAVFSGNFLDSLLATAFYNYHVLELLQMLVTGGINSQMEQHLDKEKFLGVTDSCSTFSSGRTRFVITRPANELKLLPSDLVFCAIPFSTVCEKKDGDSSQPPYEAVNIVPVESQKNIDLSYYPAVDRVSESTPRRLFNSVQPLEANPVFFSESEQVMPSPNYRFSSEIEEDENVKENEEGNMKETLKENAP
ncbi:Potassium channel subfamily U member 1 [Sciurus carolinensis]|uniref:Potassium channel subfamily U member 1 n=1 Tax=Sciurus carolinensis TaxID=30640 RepID=A0AA41MBR5_SCICA|nr:Potassium channel subfamily U member 1 [Sciurus carolinensis]